MREPVLLYSTLWPKDPYGRGELPNAARLIREYRSRAWPFELHVLIGSLHEDALQIGRDQLAGLGARVELCHFPSRHAGVRAEEIAFGKESLAGLWEGRRFDVLLYLDADLWVSLSDVARAMQRLTPRSDRVVAKFPCVLRDVARVAPTNLAGYCHHRSLLARVPYSGVIFPRRPDGKRAGAPDCLLHGHLARHGCRMVSISEAVTRHYTRPGQYLQHDQGRCSRHAALTDVLGFDPELSDMAMEPESLLAVARLVAALAPETVLELGAGSGNMTRTLLCAGVGHLVSVDQESAYLRHVDRLLRREHPGARVELRTVRLSGGAYVLGDLADRAFDLAVVDGPAGQARGRARSALAVRAEHYLFHDAHRDRQAMRWFAGRLGPCRLEEWDVGRGLALVSRGR